MFTNVEKQEIKEEIGFNKAMDKQIKRDNKYFGSIFKNRNNEMPTISDLNAIAITHRQMDMKLIQLKRLLLVMAILALTLTVIFILSKIQISGENRTENFDNIEKSEKDNNLDNKITNYDKLIELNESEYYKKVLMTQETETSSTISTIQTMTTMTTMQTTTNKQVEYILATIMINRATVPHKDLFSKGSDAYVDLYLDDIKIGSTNAIKNTNNPQWNYRFMHEIKLSVNSVIYFEIFDKDLTKNDFIGGLTVYISKLMAEGLNGKITSENYGRGSLWFTVSWAQLD